MLWEHPSWEAWNEKIQTEPLAILYIGNTTCAICIDDYHFLKPYEETMLVGKGDNIADAQLAGQAIAFAFPTAILYHYGREVHRESRIIDFQRLKEQIDYYQQLELEER